MRSGILKISSRVLESCRISPLIFDLNVELVRIGDFVGGDDPGTHGRERVERLAHQPLRSGALVIAGRDVVDDGVAEDVIGPAFGRDVAAASADDESEFGFVIGRFRNLRKDDVRSGPDDGGRRTC